MVAILMMTRLFLKGGCNGKKFIFILGHVLFWCRNRGISHISIVCGDTMTYASAQDLAEQTRLTPRYFQKLAADQMIEFAVQPGGPGTAWRFELEGFREWWEAGRPINKTQNRKQRKQWRRCTKGARSGGGASNMRARNTESHLKQRVRQMLTGS